MQRIIEIEDQNNVDLTGFKQHGFKRKRSTSTAGLEIQAEIARALDSNHFNKIKFNWFNDSFESYKIKCKNLLL